MTMPKPEPVRNLNSSRWLSTSPHDTFSALSLTSYAPWDASLSSRKPIRSSHLTAAATPGCLAPRY